MSTARLPQNRAKGLALALFILSTAGCDGTPAGPTQGGSSTPTQSSSSPTPGRAATANRQPSASAPATGAATGVEGLVSKPLGEGFVLVDDGVTVDSQSPFVGVIVPEAKASSFYYGDHGKASGYFTPTVAQVLDVARTLRERSWSKHPGIAKQLPKYRYHVVGVVLDGKRTLFLNAFCDARDDWHRKPVGVDDGGDCYFQLTFDPATKSVVTLTVNGKG